MDCMCWCVGLVLGLGLIVYCRIWRPLIYLMAAEVDWGRDYGGLEHQPLRPGRCYKINMADTTVQNADYFLCSCYFSRNIFLQEYKLHVNFMSPDQFRKEYREVRTGFVIFITCLFVCNRAFIVGIFRYAATLNALNWAGLGLSLQDL